MPKYTPVDYDPFAPKGVTYTPVDYDPFQPISQDQVNDGGFSLRKAGGLMDSDARRGELGVLNNPDGSVSTEISTTVTDPRVNAGRPTNIPLLVKGQKSVSSLQDGNDPTPEQQEIAILRAAERSGKGSALPSYRSIDAAVAAAEKRSADKGTDQSYFNRTRPQSSDSVETGDGPPAFDGTTPEQMHGVLGKTLDAIGREVPRSAASGIGGLMQFGVDMSRLGSQASGAAHLPYLGKLNESLLQPIERGAQGVRSEVAQERQADKDAGLSTPLSRILGGVEEGLFQLPEYMFPEGRLGRWTGAAVKALPVAAEATKERYSQLVAQGMTPADAAKAAAVTGIATEAGGIIPLGASGNLATRAATSAPVGVAQYEATRRAENAVLPDSMQQPFDPEAATVAGVSSAGLGAAFGHKSSVNEGIRLADEIIKSAGVKDSGPPPKPDIGNPTSEQNQPVKENPEPVSSVDPQLARLEEIQAQQRKTLKDQSEQEILAQTVKTTPNFYPGDVETMRALLKEAGLPQGSVVMKDGQPVGLRFGRSVAEKVAPILSSVKESLPTEPAREAAPVDNTNVLPETGIPVTEKPNVSIPEQSVQQPAAQLDAGSELRSGGNDAPAGERIPEGRDIVASDQTDGGKNGPAISAGIHGATAETDYTPRFNELRARRGSLSESENTELHDLYETDRTTAKMGGKPMLGVKNRVAYEEALAAGKLKPAQVFTDADNFKSVNDKLGHNVGDNVLRDLGDAYKEAFGEGNVHHFGGDEFVPQADTPEQAHAAMEQVRAKMAAKTYRAFDNNENVIGQRDGIGISYGVGKDKAEAEHEQYIDKARRAAAGLRTERATDDRRVAERTASEPETRPEGGADRGGGQAARLTFKTSKGSTYQVHEDGTTTRDKAARSDVGHEGDSGPKERSARTVYVDSNAGALSAAGLSNLGEKGARVAIKNGKATLLTWNKASNKWGTTPTSRDVIVHDKPAVGRSPLELWKPKDDVPGHEAYSGMHAGNPITEIGETPKLSRGTQSGGTVESARTAAEKAWGRDAIHKLTTRGGLEFTTVADAVARKLGGHETPEALKGVKGFYDPKTGKAHVMADNVAPENVAGVVSHEVFHANAEKFLGDSRFKALKTAFGRLKDQAVKDAYAKVPKETPEAHRDEEAMAYLVEDVPNHPASKRIVDQAKLFLNRMGIPLNWLNAHDAAVREIARQNLSHATESKVVPRGTPDSQVPKKGTSETDVMYSKRTPEDDQSDHGNGVLSEEALAKVMEKPRAPGESREAYTDRITSKDRAEMKAGIVSALTQRNVGRGEMRAMWAKTERALDVAQHAFEKSIKYFDKQKPIDNLKAIDQWETGDTVSDPHARLFFEAMKQGFDERVEHIRELSPGALQDVIENYFPHLWEDPTKAAKWYQGIMSKRPLQGNKSFLKQRYWGTIREGIEAGLKPASTNPVDLVISKMAQMDKYIAALEFKKNLEERGWVQRVKAGERLPVGYAVVEDPAFRAQHAFVVKGENGAPDTAGTAHFNHAVPEMIARDINNYLSPSLYRFGAFKVLRTIQNLVMSMRLGWSGFHAGFTTVDNAVMHVDVAARQFLQGDVVGGLKTMAQGIASPMLAPYEGGVLGKQWLGQKSVDPNTKAILDALELGGARRLMSTSDYNRAIPKFRRAIWKKDFVATAKNLLPAVGEASSYLIHHKLVPAQKMAARVLLMKFELDRVAHQLGKGRGDYSAIVDAMHPDALKQIAGSVVDAVDNRLGQMAYDNQFWNKTARELAQVAIGAVGWQVGTVRTVTGGLRDVAHLWDPEKLVSPLDKAGKLTGENMERFGRLSYLLSLALTMGGSAAALQYALTGQAPTDKKDYFFPKTGRKNPDGTDERVSFPSYWMDHYKLATHPLETAEHKIHPTISMFLEALTNKDYYGTQIHDEEAPWYKQAEQVGEYVAKGFLPYTVTGIKEANKAGTSTGQNVGQFFGVAKAPASVSRSPMQAFVYERNAFKRPQTTTVEQSEKYAARRDALTAMRTGQKADTSALTDREVKSLTKRAAIDPVVEKFKSLALTDKFRAYELASPDERKQYELKDLIEDSYHRANKEQRDLLDDRYSKLESEKP